MHEQIFNVTIIFVILNLLTNSSYLMCFIFQDLHLAIEIGIEAIFDFFHKATHLLLSPSEAFAILLSWFSSSSRSPKENHGEVAYDETVQTATLGDTDPSPTERPVESPTRLYNSMNTDTRTCQDVITELG